MVSAARSDNARMLTLEQGAKYAGMGISFFRKWSAQIGARRVFSDRLVRYDRAIIDKALDEMKSEPQDA